MSTAASRSRMLHSAAIAAAAAVVVAAVSKVHHIVSTGQV
jgi:hypothetical protein